MATKLRKRLSTKGIKLKLFEFKDVICSICQSILVEPVTLPCQHSFCQRCFSGSVENNALCCPLCRLRIGSWLRTATKQNNLVNNELWNHIQKKFPVEIDTKLKGGDVYIEDSGKPILRLSVPGEIRSEYEREMERLKEERIQLEQKHIQETELLIKKIQLEEAEAQKQYVEMLKKDEMLAKQIQRQDSNISSTKRKPLLRHDIANAKTRLKPTRIDGYLAKTQAPVNLSTPILTDDNTSTSDSSSSAPINNPPSPEMVPNYSKIICNVVQNKCDNIVHNGEQCSKNNAENPSQNNSTEKNCADTKLNGEVLNCKDIVPKSKQACAKQPPPTRKSLPISIPLPFSRVPKNKPLSLDHNKLIPLGIIQRKNDLNYKNTLKFMTSQKEKSQEKEVPKIAIEENKHTVSPEVKSDENKSVHEKVDAPETSLGTGSVDSMHQELCYFKPIKKSPSMSFAQCNTNLPVRVPSHRAGGEPCSQPPGFALRPPSRAQYIEGLCRLRQLSLANKLSSAFVIALDILKVKERANEKCDNKSTKRRAAPYEQLIKRNAVNKKIKTSAQNNGEPTPSRRRTRSMGSLVKDENTPKKIKIDDRNAISERKPYLRSNSKKVTPRKNPYYPNCKLRNDKVNPAAKNLTDPLNNCDMVTILEQIRIQKLIEQEKQDIELARQIDADINGRRQMRRPAPVKRQVTLSQTLRPAKKLKL